MSLSLCATNVCKQRGVGGNPRIWGRIHVLDSKLNGKTCYHSYRSCFILSLLCEFKNHPLNSVRTQDISVHSGRWLSLLEISWVKYAPISRVWRSFNHSLTLVTPPKMYNIPFTISLAWSQRPVGYVPWASTSSQWCFSTKVSFKFPLLLCYMHSEDSYLVTRIIHSKMIHCFSVVQAPECKDSFVKTTGGMSNS